MKNEVTTFKAPANLGGFAIRVIEINGEPWFVTADVCRALGRGNPQKALMVLDPDQKGRITCPTPGGPQQLSVVSESGFNLLVMRVQRQGRAKQFQDWVTREVLPAIRKDGMYVMGEEKLRTGEMSADEFWARTVLWADQKIKRVTAERDQETERADVAEQRVAVLEDERRFLTVDQYVAEKGQFGKYRTRGEKALIGQHAARLAKARGIKLERQPRLVRLKGGGLKEGFVNILPRELLDEVCSTMGLTAPAPVVALAPPRSRRLH